MLQSNQRFAQVVAVGDKCIGLMQTDHVILVVDRQEAEDQLAMYRSLFPEKHGVLETAEQLFNVVQSCPAVVGNAVDCCYFVPLSILADIGAVSGGDRFRFINDSARG